MTQVQEERITEEDLWERFHNIPSVQQTIVLRRMNFLGKVIRVRGSPEAPARLVLIANVDNPRPRGRPITSTKASLFTDQKPPHFWRIQRIRIRSRRYGLP